MQTLQSAPRPSTWELFKIWTAIGLQSFGGSTSLLIQREFIFKRHWMTMEDFALFWSQCVFTPGINLVALTILIGKKLGGIAGVVVSLCGMLVPSATITCLLTIGFSYIEHQAATQAVLKGMIPATAGFLLVVGLNFAQPELKTAYKKNWLHLVICLAIVCASLIAINLFNISIMLVLMGAAIISMLIFTPWRSKHTQQTEIEQEAQEVKK
jgi:chromate transporter